MQKKHPFCFSQNRYFCIKIHLYKFFLYNFFAG
nr:MAG TPA: hypothetical protein [Caudoviricetes sp.]